MDYKTIVCKENSLIRASFQITLNEQRLILACIAQIKDPREPITRDDKFTITAEDFGKRFGIDMKHAYNELGSAAKLLTNREVIIERPDPDNPKLSRTVTGWAESADYYDGEGKVVIKFREKMCPYLSRLKDGCFTKYRIDKIAKIKSVHAIRLYELLLSEAWKNKDYEIEIATLKNMLQITEKYESTYDLKRYIIDPALKSINKHTDVKASYEQKKSGREVKSLVFTFSLKKEADNKPKPKLTQPIVPLFTGHKDAPKVDNDAHFADLEKRYGKK